MGLRRSRLSLHPIAGALDRTGLDGHIVDFSLTGILSRLSSALAEARIGVFAVSTFNTDYILVRTADFDRAREALRRIGCEWRDEK